MWKNAYKPKRWSSSNNIWNTKIEHRWKNKFSWSEQENWRIKWQEQVENQLLKLLSVQVTPLWSVWLVDNVTWSCNLVQISMQKWNKKFYQNYLIDFGGYQWLPNNLDKTYNKSLLFDQFWIKLQDINWVILTHPHYDHFWRIPLLVKYHEWHKRYMWNFYLHFSWRDLIRLSLEEQVRLMENKVDELNDEKSRLFSIINDFYNKTASKDIKKYIKSTKIPRNLIIDEKWEIQIDWLLENEEEIYNIIFSNNFTKDEKFKIVKKLYNKKIKIAEEMKLFDENDIINVMSKMHLVSDSSLQEIWIWIRMWLYRSWHMLWASQAFLEITDEVWNKVNILFSGDLWRQNHFILPKPTVPKDNIDLFVCEWTYWWEYHPDFDTEIEKLKNKLKEVIKRNGKVLIPCFKKQRMQDVLCIIIDLVKEIKEEMEDELIEEYKRRKYNAKRLAVSKLQSETINQRANELNINNIDPQIEEKARKIAYQQLVENWLTIFKPTFTKQQIENYLNKQERIKTNTKLEEKLKELEELWAIKAECDKRFQNHLQQRTRTLANKAIRNLFGKKMKKATNEEKEELYQQKLTEIQKNKNDLKKTKERIKKDYMEELRSKLKNEIEKSNNQLKKDEINSRLVKFTESWNIDFSDILIENQDWNCVSLAKIELNKIEIQNKINKNLSEKLKTFVDTIVKNKLEKFRNKNKNVTTDQIESEKQRRIEEIKNSTEYENKKTNLYNEISEKYFNKILFEIKTKKSQEIFTELKNKLLEKLKNLNIDEETISIIYNTVLFNLNKEINNLIQKKIKELKWKKSNINEYERVTIKNDIILKELNNILINVVNKTKQEFFNNIEKRIKAKIEKKEKMKTIEELKAIQLEKHNQEIQELIETETIKVIEKIKRKYVKHFQWKWIKEKIINDNEVNKELAKIDDRIERELKLELKRLPQVPIFATGSDIEMINEQYIQHFSSPRWEKLYQKFLTQTHTNSKWHITRVKLYKTIKDLHNNWFIWKIDKETWEPTTQFPAILCASSWMMSWWAIMGYISRILENEANCLVRVWYMGTNTLWRKIFDTPKTWQKEIVDKRLWTIQINAELHETACFSTHWDQQDIEDHIAKLLFVPEWKVMINHWAQDKIKTLIQWLKANEIIAQKWVEIWECLLNIPIKVFPKE